jgi:diguanylate cyclase (GGDEF)-like protein
MGEEMIGNVAGRAEPILATDIKLFSEPTKSLEPTLQLLARSAACVPIIENNKVLGVLGAFSTHENEFHEEDIHLLQMMSQAASAAVRNAWLFDQIDKQRATILAAVNMLPQPMMIVDQDGKIIVSNRAADAMLNDIHASWNGKGGTNKSSLVSLTTLMSDLAESKWHTKELIVGDKVYVATLEYASMVGTVILMQDVTDPVTGTSSHRHFQDMAQQAFEQAKRYKKPLSALAVGLDDLKRVINDQGSVTANQILKGLATELRSFLRTPDILGRYQDNEFVVLLPETNLENAIVVAERIVGAISKKSIMIENHKVPFKLSIGVATLDFQTDTSIDILMRKADEASMPARNDHNWQIKVYKNA